MVLDTTSNGMDDLLTLVRIFHALYYPGRNDTRVYCQQVTQSPSPLSNGAFISFSRSDSVFGHLAHQACDAMFGLASSPSLGNQRLVERVAVVDRAPDGRSI